MSERTVSENNKLWETAEKIAQQVVAEKKAESEEERRKQKKRVIKLLLLLVLIALIIVFASIAWFAMNKQTGAGGMGVKSQATPYTIQTRSESGYYKSKWDRINSDAAEWQVSPANNFDNHVQAMGEDEQEPGLEPGDSGMLEFRVDPNVSDSITVDCVFDVKAYLEKPVLNQGEPVLDVNSEPVTKITEISNTALLGYVKAHIMLFSGKDEQTGKYTGLISTDEELKRVLKDLTYTRGDTAYTKIYWVWPEHLYELTSENPDRVIYAPTERKGIIDYIAANKDGFFKDCSDSVQKVTTDLTALSVAYNTSVYNHYNIKYDNADLDIGNNISYIMLSMTVKQ